MFDNAPDFNQNLGGWNLGAATDMTDMLKNSGLSVANYDATLIGWNNAGYTEKILGDASPLQYCAAQSARNNLTANKGWTITGDTYSSTCPDINLKANDNPIAFGSTQPSSDNHTDFGSQLVSSGTIVRIFTVENTGGAALTVPSDGITVLGIHANEFSIGGITLPATIAGGNSVTFTVTFDPAATGLRTATIAIANDDTDERNYTFAIQGTGTLPADYTITTTNGNIVINDITGTGETLDISENSGNIRFNVTGKTYSIDGGTTTAFTTPAEVLLLNKTSITVNTAVGNDVINVGAFSTQLPSLTINGGTGDDQVFMNGDITLAANANLDLDLQNDDATPGTDAVVIASNAAVTLSGTGTATVKVSKNVTVNTGASLITQNGNLIVEANQQTTPTTGDFVGVDVNGGTLKLTGSGQANVKGKSGTAGYKSGISVNNGGLIQGGTAQLSVIGTGGTAEGNENIGVLVTDTDSKITSSGGNVSVTGQGSGLADGNNQHGVVVKTSGMITAGGVGTVTVQGIGGSISGGSTFGVYVNSGTVTSSGGNVSVTGQGGGNGGSNNYGVFLESSGLLTAGGTGTVTVHGTGGSGTNGPHQGIYLITSAITSTNGAINLVGQAGGISTSSNNTGVLLTNTSRIAAGGTGSVTVEGTGSTSSASYNYGLQLYDVNSQVSTNNGNIRLIGQGGQGMGFSDGNTGIGLGGSIIAGGTGTIYIEGTGASQSFSDGVEVDNAVTTNNGTITIIGVGGANAAAQTGSNGVELTGTVSAGNGQAIVIQGTAGASTGSGNIGARIQGSISSTTGGTISVTGIEGGSGVGILMESEGTISTLTNGGNISLITNSIDMTGTSAISTNAASSVILRPYTNGVNIDLGAATNPLAGPLGLSDAELDRITAGTLQIGNANSGAITVSTAISRTANTAMNLTSGGAVNFNSSSLNLNGGNLSINATGGINPTAAGTDVTVGTASFTSGNDLNIVINGTTADTDYRQLNIAGSVNLTGLDLGLTGSHTPVAGQTFTIIDNDGSDAITGTFNGLAQGATLPNFLGSGLNATISYTGGDGNDAVIAINNTNPTITAAAAVTRLEGNPGSIATIATVNDAETPAGNLTVTVTTLPPDISVSNITNVSGTITATVAVVCGPRNGTNRVELVELTVTDANGGTATVNLTVNVTGRAAPTLTYNNAFFSPGAGGSIFPTTGPSENDGTPIPVFLQNVSPSSSPATITVNSSTGEVSVPNNIPVGIYTITVRTTNRCTTSTVVPITLSVQSADYTITTTGNNVVITDVTGTGETLNISENNGNVRFNVTGKTYSIDGGTTTAFTTPAEVPLLNKTSITVNAAVGNDVINVATFTSQLPTLTINGGTGDDQVFMNGDITFAPNANLDIDLQNDDATPGVDIIMVNTDANLIFSGTGAITLKASKTIETKSGSSLSAIAGNILIEANQQVTPTGGSFNGISHRVL